jgi:tripartite-type tricarboxylate transporter receptor subunit TctC
MRNTCNFALGSLSGLLVTVLTLSFASAAESYKDKTVRLIVGTNPGGGFDTYSRAIARSLGKQIPGSPRIIVQNMPGGGFAIAMNYLFNIAKPNGLAIGATNSGLVMKQIVNVKGLRFDMRKFGWLGSAGTATPTCMVMARTGVKNLQDLMTAEKPVNFGSAGTLTREGPLILRDFVGGKVNMVEGYQGTAQIRAAIQRDEVDGYCSSWESVRVRAKELLSATGGDRLIPIVTSGDRDDPVLKDLPTFSSAIKSKEDLAAFEAWLGPYKFFRSFVTPPNTPEATLDTLKVAFKNTLDDPEFRAVSKKIGIEISYLSGPDIEKLLAQIFSIPPAAKDRLQQLILGK